MMIRILLTGTTLLLLALAASVGAAVGAEPNGIQITGLENVRAYAAAAQADGRGYAVDGGRLYAGTRSDGWRPVSTPPGVIVNSVALDRFDPNTVYIGAANRLSVFVSRNAARDWVEIPMKSNVLGGVTALAFDAANRLLYVGTDNDGVYRLRDVGAAGRGGLIASGHLLLEEPVEEIATDNTGAGLTLARTVGKLYRAEAFGLRWVAVDGLPGRPTAVAVADTSPPRVYAGTAGAGVVVSWDGIAWRSIGRGLGVPDGDQLVISSLAIDPAQPEVMYAGAIGAGVLQRSSSNAAMSSDGGAHWSLLAKLDGVEVVELLPVTGQTGTVYALTTASRTPLALGGAVTVEMPETAEPPAAGLSATTLLIWILAGHASAALIILAVSEFGRGKRRRVEPAFSMDTVRIG